MSNTAMFKKPTPMDQSKPLDLATVAREVSKGEAFVPVVSEDIFEYAASPVFRAIRRQLFGGACDSEAEEQRAQEFWASTSGIVLKSLLYDYAAIELMNRSTELNKKISK